MRQQEEHDEQRALMQWWALYSKSKGLPECLLFAIPNGGFRHISVAMKLKQEGVRAGVPDLFLALPCGNYHGLFIEMKKAKGGRVSDSQNAVMTSLVRQGYACAVCHGWTAARLQIERYFAPVAPEVLAPALSNGSKGAK